MRAFGISLGIALLAGTVAMPILYGDNAEDSWEFLFGPDSPFKREIGVGPALINNGRHFAVGSGLFEYHKVNMKVGKGK